MNPYGLAGKRAQSYVTPYPHFHPNPLRPCYVKGFQIPSGTSTPQLLLLLHVRMLPHAAECCVARPHPTRPRYVERFKTPVHCELLGRLVLGNVVVDRCVCISVRLCISSMPGVQDELLGRLVLGNVVVDRCV